MAKKKKQKQKEENTMPAPETSIAKAFRSKHGDKIDTIHAKAKEIAMFIDNNLPDCIESQQAILRLRECVGWCVSAAKCRE